MLRLGITIGLLLSFLALAKGVSVTWEKAFRWEPPLVEKKKPARPLPSRKKILFYPPVPAELPDLNKGYMFNADRSLSEESKGAGEGQDVEVNVNIADVSYSGSIITADSRIAILSFPGEKRPSGISRMRIKTLRHAQVKEGATFSGYTVAEIHPDRVLFQRGEEKIEKFLYDPDKKRTIGINPPAAERKTVTPIKQLSPAQSNSAPAHRIGTPTPAGRNVPLRRPPIAIKPLDRSP